MYDRVKNTYRRGRQVDSYKVPTSELMKQSGLRRQKVAERYKSPEEL